VKKILIIHNKYLNLGGEDLVVLNETKLLSKNYNVENLYFHNTKKLEISDYWSLLFGRNRKSEKIIRDKIKEFNPDIVYFHNLWYKINTKTVLKACKNIEQIFIKQHNLRHECIQGMHYRNESLCHSCQTKGILQGIRKKCYHDSYLKSFLMTLFSRRYLKILRNNKIKILTFSNFHIDRLVTNKVDNDKIFKLNNYLEKTPTPEIKINLPQKYICFVGRASKEKGVHIITEAFINSNLKDTKLLIVGNISADIDTAKYSKYAEIEFKNQLKNEEVRFLMSKSRAVIMGSIAYEGHPVTLSEAIISNSVLIYPSFSGLDELMPLDYDYSYFHNDIEDLTRVMNLLDDEKTYSKNKSSLKVFKEKKYSEDLFFDQFQIALDCK